MKNIIGILIAFAIVSCSNAQKNTFSKAALEGELKTLEDSNVNLKAILEKHTGKTIVIEFWASWCSDCVKAMPKLKELQAKHPDVDFVFVSLDKTAEKWKLGIEKHNLVGDHYWIDDKEGMKGSFGKSVDLDWIPRYIIIDKNGKIALYRAIEKDFEKMNNTLNTLK